MTTNKGYKTVREERMEKDVARAKRPEICGDLAGLLNSLATLAIWLYLTFFLWGDKR